MALKTKGMTRLVTPPPMLPQPAEVALARPTTDLLCICVHQTWLGLGSGSGLGFGFGFGTTASVHVCLCVQQTCEVTKLARPRPIAPLHTARLDKLAALRPQVDALCRVLRLEAVEARLAEPEP